MQNPHDQQRKDYEAHARKLWGHDANPLNADASAAAALVPAVTIIADAANAPNAPTQSDDHGSASQIDNTVPTTSAAPAVKDGKTQAAMPAVKPGALPLAGLDNPGNEELTPENAYRKAWAAAGN